MDSDHHALVQGFARRHEHASAFLQLPQRISDGRSVILADEHAVATLFHVALDGTVVVEDVAGKARASRERKKFALETDQAASGNPVFEPHAALAVRLHVL